LDWGIPVHSFPTPIAAAATFAGALLLAAPAGAVTFANFNQVGTARTVHWVRDANTGLAALNGNLFTGPDAATHGAIDIRFYFQLPALAAFENLPARLTINARETGFAAGIDASNAVTQTQVDGNTATTGFSIIYNGPTVVLAGHTVTAGANLLSAKFTNIWIQGVRVANAGSLADSQPTPGTIDFTSDFMTFAGATERGLAWDLTSISPVLGFEAGKALPSFNASVSGAFSAMIVPEPAAWSLMIAGFGAAGVFLRRRRSAPAPT
jgi:hypothetical protein